MEDACRDFATSTSTSHSCICFNLLKVGLFFGLNRPPQGTLRRPAHLHLLASIVSSRTIKERAQDITVPESVRSPFQDLRFRLSIVNMRLAFLLRSRLFVHDVHGATTRSPPVCRITFPSQHLVVHSAQPQRNGPDKGPSQSKFCATVEKGNKRVFGRRDE